MVQESRSFQLACRLYRGGVGLDAGQVCAELREQPRKDVSELLPFICQALVACMVRGRDFEAVQKMLLDWCSAQTTIDESGQLGNSRDIIFKMFVVSSLRSAIDKSHKCYNQIQNFANKCYIHACQSDKQSISSHPISDQTTNAENYDWKKDASISQNARDQLIQIHEKLGGEGEGVTQLVARSVLKKPAIVVEEQQAITEIYSPPTNQFSFDASISFLEQITKLSHDLKFVQQQDRATKLYIQLDQLDQQIQERNKKGIATIIPLGQKPQRILRICAGDALVMNSKEKVPYLLFFEVQEIQEEYNCARNSMSSASYEDPLEFDDYENDNQIRFETCPQSWTDFGQQYSNLNLNPNPTNPDLSQTFSGPDSSQNQNSDSSQTQSQDLSRQQSLPQNQSLQSSWSSASAYERQYLDRVMSLINDCWWFEGPFFQSSIPQQQQFRGEILNLPRRMSSREGLDTVVKQLNIRELPSPAWRGATSPAGSEISSVGLHHTSMENGMSFKMHKQQEVAEKVYGRRWVEREGQKRDASPYGHLPGWKLQCVIVKSGDDCLQEQLALALIAQFRDIFAGEALPLFVADYQVYPVTNRSAIIEFIKDAQSVHNVKKKSSVLRLSEHFYAKFPRHTAKCRTARRRFAESMAAYSVICYLLQVKDRHNGNIMIDDLGHIIHIDFGFMISNSPGGDLNFERAPFKLTREYMEVMDANNSKGASQSETYNYFKVLFIQGLLAARRNANKLIGLVDIMSKSGCPCFKKGKPALEEMRRRFMLQFSEVQATRAAMELIYRSADAWTSRQYDFYQRAYNGIL